MNQLKLVELAESSVVRMDHLYGIQIIPGSDLFSVRFSPRSTCFQDVRQCQKGCCSCLSYTHPKLIAITHKRNQKPRRYVEKIDLYAVSSEREQLDAKNAEKMVDRMIERTEKAAKEASEKAAEANATLLQAEQIQDKID